jgi:putative transposase
MQAFKMNQILYLNDVQVRMVRKISENEVQFENTETGELTKHYIYSLMQAYVAGTLKTTADRRHELRYGSLREHGPARMNGMSPAARKDTLRRIDILTRLRNMGSFEKSKADLRKDLEQIAIVRGEHRPIHESTVYRWRKSFLRAERDVRALFAELDKRGGRGKPRHDPMVEAMIDSAIDDQVAKGKGLHAVDVHLAVLLAVQQENTTRIETEHLKVPGLRTIQRRIANLYSFEVALANYGRKEAERRHAFNGKSRSVDRILELVEIDHTPADILVVDETGKVIGRPMLTILLDRYSRCVLGYLLSLAGTGTPAVFSALRHALLPKTYLDSQYGGKLDWPCFGWPERILMDNGREFHADAVRDALANISIVTEYAGSRDPNDKPFIERFNRTINYTLIHKLPGTTLSHVHKRVGFKSEAEACLTLEQLDEIIHVWICDKYHRRPHSGLDGRAPIDVWMESAKAYPPQLKMNREDLDIELCDVETRTLQLYGIDNNTFQYASPQLSLLGRMLTGSREVTIKAPRYDVGFIWVWNPLDKEYIKAHNKEEEYHGLTLEQARAVKKRRAEGAPDYQLTNARADAICNDIVEEALADKKLRNRKKGSRLKNDTTDKLRHDPPDAPVAPLDEDAAIHDEPSAMPDVAVLIELPADIDVEEA